MTKWVDDLFKAGAVAQDKSVRRGIIWIQKKNAEAEIRERCRVSGYIILEQGDQWIIFCDPAFRVIFDPNQPGPNPAP